MYFIIFAVKIQVCSIMEGRFVLNTECEWRYIPGYLGRYLVSTKGDVASMCRGFRIMKPEVKEHRGKYARVNLYKDGKFVHRSVHRLVALTFIPNPENKPEIDHIDGNPLNNDVSNLRWVTRSENEMNPITRDRLSKVRKGRRVTCGDKISKTLSKRVGKLNSHSIPVAQYTLDGKLVKIHESTCLAAKELGLHQAAIWKCTKGIIKKSGGFIWRNL